MTIYLLIDEPVPDFGDHSIQGVFLSQANAVKKMKELKGENPYNWQYLRVTGYKVEDYPK